MNRIVDWTRRGIQWREMGVVEVLWMVHTDNIGNLAQHHPTLLRRYLTDTKDFVTLSAWDKQQMKDKQSDRGE